MKKFIFGFTAFCLTFGLIAVQGAQAQEDGSVTVTRAPIIITTTTAPVKTTTTSTVTSTVPPTTAVTTSTTVISPPPTAPPTTPPPPPPTAPPVTAAPAPPPPPQEPRYLSVGREAVARINAPLPPGWKVNILPGRDGYLGMADGGTKTIDLYVRDTKSVEFMAHVYAHEVGHSYDFTYNTTERRQQWMSMRGINPNTVWFGCNGCTDYQTPAGDYAEVFAYWHTRFDFKSQMAPRPDEAQLQRLVPLMQP